MDQIKRVYPKGAIIIKQGDYGDEAFQLISGSVEVGFISADGNKTILTISHNHLIDYFELYMSFVNKFDKRLETLVKCSLMG